MSQYLLSIYQPDGDVPPPEILDPIMRDVDAVARDAKAAGVRADLLRRLGRTEDDATSYGRAIELAGNEVERAFLRGHRASLV